MRAAMACFILPHLLFSLACLINAPEELSNDVPNTTPDPAITVTPKTTPGSVSQSGAVRTIENHFVLFCMKDGQVMEHTNACPMNAHQVGITPFTAAEQIAIKQFEATLTPAPQEDHGEPCGEVRTIQSAKPLADQVVNRPLKLHDVKSEKYKQRIAEAAKLPDVELTVLARVDLDGNGTEEVLFEANSHGLGLVEGPAHIISLVGIRAIVDGKVITQFLHKEDHKLNEGDGITYWLQGSLQGLTDLEGDGRLEVVWNSTYYEGGSTLVFAFDGKTLTELGSNGCGA